MTKCSFCSLNAATLVPGSLTDIGLCLPCLHNMNIQLGKIPDGAIYCFKCKSYESFVLQYDNKTKVGFLFEKLDENNHAIYSAIASSGVWDRRKKPKSCLCVTCKSKTKIPMWMLGQNNYVKKFADKSMENK